MALLAVGGLLLLGGPSHTALRLPSALAQGVPLLSPPAPQAREPQFSSSPTPEGDVSLQNLHFQPLEFSGFPAFLPRLKVAYRDNTVTLTDVGTRPMVIVNAGKTDVPNKEVKVWSGPAAAASFTQETVGGVHTLKDSGGNVLWSDAADIAKPDLLFEKTEDGQSRLTNGAGATLWSGHLPPAPPGGVGGRSQADQISIVAPSICIEGKGGFFRVTSGRLLWTGHLPASPLIIIRDGHYSMIEGPNGSSGGSDETRQISMEAGAETVTISDVGGRTLGTQSVDALAIWHTDRLSSQRRGFDWPAVYETPNARLDTTGTLLLTYRDASGRVLRRSKVYKDARGNSGTLG